MITNLLVAATDTIAPLKRAKKKFIETVYLLPGGTIDRKTNLHWQVNK